MSTNNDFLAFENDQFLAFLYEQVNDRRAELISPSLAPEDRAEIEIELNTALAALKTFES